MSIDTGIQQADPNGCVFADVLPKNSPWYLSPNVVMTTQAGDPSDVFPGMNTTSVTVTWKSECTIPNSDLSIVFDLYIGDPTLPMIPGSTLDKLANLNAITISPGQTVATQVGPWPVSGLPHLSQPHHACLMARAYPFGASASAGDLTGFPIDDEHYAQHNCTVDTADGQGMFRLPIRNGVLSLKPELVAIQAVPDLNPTGATLDAILPSLRRIPSFKQIASKPLRRVEFDLTAFKTPHESLLERIEEWIEREILELIEALEGRCKHNGGVAARAVLPPNAFAKFDFIADLAGATRGEAHVYQVSQVKGDGKPYGGLTVVIVPI
jgi:hypothetical protein